MSRQDKKERKRLKRKRKQIALRKERNTSVFQKLAHRGGTGELECYINADWPHSGLASLQVYRQAGGVRVFAAYLIDLWCSGLKDAFGRTPVLREEFEDSLDRAEDRSGLEMVSIDADVARRLVAGAMRLSRENGFRLPHRAERWASVVGVTAYADADLSDFTKPDGKYRYVGTMADLRKRLVGPVDEFLARPDVEYILETTPFGGWGDVVDEGRIDGEDFVDDVDDRLEVIPPEFLDGIDAIRDRTYDVIHRWLTDAGREPHPRLGEGVDLALTAAIVESTAVEDPTVRERVPSISEVIAGDDDPESLLAALAQVTEFLGHYESPARMLEAMGHGEGPSQAEDALTPQRPA